MEQKATIRFVLLSLLIIGMVIIGTYIYNTIQTNTQSQIFEETDPYDNQVDEEILTNYDKLKDAVELDYRVHTKDYKEFKYKVYKKQPNRIYFKNSNEQGFRLIENVGSKEVDGIIEVAEEKFHYMSLEDEKMTAFKPKTIDQILESSDNYVIFNYDNSNNHIEKGIESQDFQRDIIVKIDTQSSLYRLLLYETFNEKIYSKQEVINQIQRDEFAFNTNISGYEYMEVKESLIN